MNCEEQPESAWMRSERRRHRASRIAAVIFMVYALESIVVVKGNPPAIDVSISWLREFIHLSIIAALVCDRESWKLALLGLVVLQAVIGGLILAQAGALLAIPLLVLFAVGTIGLVMFYDNGKLVALWTVFMALLPAFGCLGYLVLLR